MRGKTAFACVLSLSAALIAFAGADSTTTAKTLPNKTSAKTPKAGQETAASNAAPGKAAAPASPSKKAVSKKSAKQGVAVRHIAQQQPTPERYKEIQQALADKGYFHGAADGNWSPESVDALKRFQHDQNLPEDGKIGSLSLIALGLGPKHDAGAEVPLAAGSARPSGNDKNTPQ